MMTVIYIIIGVVVGLVVAYLVMNRRVTALQVELARKDTEMQLLSQQRAE